MIYVFIDGDGAVFRDGLIVKGEDGGSAAAHSLLEGTLVQLNAIHPIAIVNDCKIVVLVILILNGPSSKLLSCGIILGVTQVHDFG